MSKRGKIFPITEKKILFQIKTDPGSAKTADALDCGGKTKNTETAQRSKAKNGRNWLEPLESNKC